MAVTRIEAEAGRSGRAFVTFESEENLPYLLESLGEDGRLVSTDYPHGDPSADEVFVTKLQQRTDVPERVKEKLFHGNAERFYRV